MNGWKENTIEFTAPQTLRTFWQSGYSAYGLTGSEREKFESDMDMSLSNSSIGVDAPAAIFGKTAFADFVSVRL